MQSSLTMQVGELCRRLGVAYRHARYVLEQDLLPPGVDPAPDRGHHRQFTLGQSFWLGMVLKLKEAGVKAPLAAQLADFAREAVRTVSRHLGWDPSFAPFEGNLTTEHQWFLDIGDRKHVRVVTDACPSGEGLHAFDWVALGRRRAAEGVAPVVAIRVDLARLARLLRDES